MLSLVFQLFTMPFSLKIVVVLRQSFQALVAKLLVLLIIVYMILGLKIAVDNYIILMAFAVTEFVYFFEFI